MSLFPWRRKEGECRPDHAEIHVAEYVQCGETTSIRVPLLEYDRNPRFIQISEDNLREMAARFRSRLVRLPKPAPGSCGEAVGSDGGMAPATTWFCKARKGHSGPHVIALSPEDFEV